MRSRALFRTATDVRPQSARYSGVLSETNPARYYRLRLTQRSSLNLALSGLTADADLALVNQAGATLNQSSRRGSSRESLAQTVEPGTYYVRVDRRRGTPRYRLDVGVGQAQPEAQSQFSAAAGIAQTAAPTVAEQILGLVNQERRAAGLRPVRLNSRLNASAQAHSQDMALNDFFGHQGSNGSKISDRIAATGYRAFTYGENIAAGLASPESVMQSWMASPGHRKNILSSTVKEMGLGLTVLETDLGTTNYRYYWTQDFASPMF
ncbi:MAG: CAP domain-containing protein [Elainella sp.]